MDMFVLAGFYVILCLTGCAFFYQRFRYRRRQRLGKARPGFYPTGASMGNALHQLQTLAQPRMQYVLEEKLKEEVDADDEGGPDDPTRHLHRQAARIRRGEPLDRLTVLLRRRK
jgi:hypothetical protein